MYIEQPYIRYKEAEYYTDTEDVPSDATQQTFADYTCHDEFTENLFKGLIPIQDKQPLLKRYNTPKEYYERPFYEVPYPEYDISVKEYHKYKYWCYQDDETTYEVDKEDFEILMSIRANVTFVPFQYYGKCVSYKEHTISILYEKKVSQDDFLNRPWQDHEVVLKHFMIKYCQACADGLVEESLEP